ncbi:unnamed protein product [Spirodela intermedia]|uniref:Uncharacterized protein n=1 Tax=Spirodela intermedia TaxID=51605 RepID=A0A7I8L4W3_SPIIN|nr:unnamed protein product [Spirodela intermedia]
MESFQKIRDGEEQELAAEDRKPKPKTTDVGGVGGGATAEEDWKPKPEPGVGGGGGGSTAAEGRREKPKTGAVAAADRGDSSEAKRRPPRRLPHLEVPQPEDFNTEALEHL